MRISDWSSDVCSSDLPDARRLDDVARPARQRVLAIEPDIERAPHITLRSRAEARELLHFGQRHRAPGLQIGRASCRERVSVRVDLGGRRIIKKKTKILIKISNVKKKTR